MDPTFYDLYPNIKHFSTAMFPIRHEVEACVLHRAYAALGKEPIVAAFYSKRFNGYRRKGLPIAKLMKALRTKLPSNFYIACDIPWAVYVFVTQNSEWAKIGLSHNPAKRFITVGICKSELRFCRERCMVFYGFSDRASAQAFETSLKRATKAFLAIPPGCSSGHTEWRAWTSDCHEALEQAIQCLGQIERTTLPDFANRYPNETVFDLLYYSKDENADFIRQSGR